MYVCVCVSRARMQGEALMWTLADGLGDKFTEEVRVVLPCVAVCCHVLLCGHLRQMYCFCLKRAARYDLIESLVTSLI